MGMYTIKVPDIGEGIAEVELVAWRGRPSPCQSQFGKSMGFFPFGSEPFRLHRQAPPLRVRLCRLLGRVRPSLLRRRRALPVSIQAGKQKAWASDGPGSSRHNRGALT
jgi:hypothetical protein